MAGTGGFVEVEESLVGEVGDLRGQRCCHPVLNHEVAGLEALSLLLLSAPAVERTRIKPLRQPFLQAVVQPQDR